MFLALGQPRWPGPGTGRGGDRSANAGSPTSRGGPLRPRPGNRSRRLFTALVSGPSVHTTSPPVTMNRPTRSELVRSSWQLMVTTGRPQQHTHVFDEPGLATPRRTGEHHRDAPVKGQLEQLNFIAVGEIGVGGHLFPFFGGWLFVMRQQAHDGRGQAPAEAPPLVGCAGTAGARTLLAVGRPGSGRRRRNTCETPASLASSTACAASAQAYRPS